MITMPKTQRTISGSEAMEIGDLLGGNGITGAPAFRRWRPAARSRGCGCGTKTARLPRAAVPGGREAFCGRSIRCSKLSVETCHAPREERGSDAHENDHDGHGDEDQALAAVGVRQGAILLDGDFAERDALISPEQVDRGEHRAAGGPGGPLVMMFEGADQDEEFSDEAIERRQRQRREADEQKERHQHRHGIGEAAKLRDFVRVPAVVEHADPKEQRAGGDAVVEHLVDGALNRDGAEGEQCRERRIPGG